MVSDCQPAPESDVRARGGSAWQAWRGLGGAVAACLLAYVAFLLHLNLSSAGSLELLLVVVAALNWGLAEATAVSVAGVLVLNFLFIAPIFRLTVADPRNGVSLLTFEAAALLVSRLSTQARVSAVEAEKQKRRATKLYELSRAILLVDQRRPLEEQLAALIREIIQVEVVALSFNAEEASSAAQGADRQVSSRPLRIGSSVIGSISVRGWEDDPPLADAVASLTALAVERVRAVQRESRADTERDTERLRTAVLDGLAHGFKTPLTAIQTASSGLLAIGQSDPTQTELVSIIDEQAMLLNEMTTKLLKTASLDRREMQLQRSEVSLAALLDEVIAGQDTAVRKRMQVKTETGMAPCSIDAELIRLAMTQLIDNAAKYSEIGAPITVGIEQSKEENIVTVESKGVPIRPEERERIFERFYRGVNVLHGPAGTGLGLSIVRKAALAHGGRVSVQVDGPLTHFRFMVPRQVSGLKE